MRDADLKTTYLKDYRPPDYLIDWVDLRFELNPAKTVVRSRMKLRKNVPSVRGYAPLRLDGEELYLNSLSLDGGKLSEKDYQLTRDSLIIGSVPQGHYFVLEIENTINPESNTSLEGLFLSNGMFCTQCEAQGFRRISYFLDRPDVMTVFTTTLVASREHYPVLLANGNRIESGYLDGDRHWVKWQDPFKKPAYLFALVAGRLECLRDRYETLSKRPIELAIYVEPHNLDKCDHAMASLKKAMAWDEKVYGREYDLDLYMIVAVGHFNMGAMENKGLNIFNAKFVLARADTATDADYEQIEGVIGHEYFHNWSGNRVTCRDWFQLSLKEGFTVFRDQEFSADHGSRGVKRVGDVNRLRTFQFAEDAGPLAHPVRPDSYIEINNFYTLTVYEKGAEIVRMIHTMVGEQGFRKGTDLYFNRHDGQAVTTDDFVKAMEDANGIDLGQFRLWYQQSGTPLLKIGSQYDPSNRCLNLEISQE
ncbi:MAG: aminopeptidase N, partial [Methylococcales bacterium]